MGKHLWQESKEVVRGSYFHLLALFVLAVFLLKIGVLPSWQLNFVVFAVILGLFGWTLIDSKVKVNIPHWFLWAALALAIAVRVLPYFFSSVPLGYDPGWHKYPFEHPFADEWIKQVFPLPFLVVMAGLTAILGSWFVLVPLFIALSASTAVMLYYTGRRLFSTEVGLLAAAIFAVSIAQFETFWYNYYKNVFGILLLLLSFLFIEDNKRFNWKLILIGVLIGGAHQPAFFIFGITYFLYVLFDVRNFRKPEFWYAVLNGALILVGVVLTNFDRIFHLFLPQAVYAAQGLAGGGGSGTFFNSLNYFYYTVPFIPFALTGFFHSWRKHVPLTIAAVITALVVVLELFFYNRFIIYLDIFVVLFAAIGCVVLMQNRPSYGRWIVYAFLVLSVVLLVMHSWAARPLVSEGELADIERLNTITEENALVMSTDKYYSPWLKGYVDRPIIAPGLFDEDKMDQSQWNEFWSGQNRQMYLNQYGIPLYIYVGKQQPQFNFSDVCSPMQLETATLYKCT